MSDSRQKDSSPALAERLAEEFGALGPGASIIVVGELAVEEADVPADTDLRRLPSDATLADLDSCGRYDLGLVLALPAPLPASRSVQLIGRLRDVHVRRLLVAADAAAQACRNDMLALGFERHTEPASGETIYVYDRDAYNREREWNTPENWANPENFDKYRW